MYNDFFNKYIDYASDYGDGLSSHIPMVSYSLYEFGVPLNEIELYLDKTIEEIEITKEDMTDLYKIDDDNFEEFLGIKDSLGSYYIYFCKIINESNYLDIVGEFLPKLIRGVASRAFHPLIRLSFAVRSENEKEVAKSLSYFAATFLPHPFEVLPHAVENTLDNIKIIVESVKDENYKGDLIADRIEKIYGLDGFKKNAFTLKGDEKEVLSQLDLIINKLFIETKHFTILHGVTSKEALKNLLPLLKDKYEILQNYWLAILAAYISIDSPEIKNLSIEIPENLPEFQDIIKVSIRSHNDHTIKLANSCRIEFERSHDKVYKYMAYLRAFT